MLVSVIDQHATVTTELIRGNQAPFINKDGNKAIMGRS